MAWRTGSTRAQYTANSNTAATSPTAMPARKPATAAVPTTSATIARSSADSRPQLPTTASWIICSARNISSAPIAGSGSQASSDGPATSAATQGSAAHSAMRRCRRPSRMFIVDKPSW
jgi:hypothetical protein